MTLEKWKDFFERMGLVEVKAVDFSEEIPDMEKAMMKELGIKGMVKMACTLLVRSDLRRAMIEYWNIFNIWVYLNIMWERCIVYGHECR